MGQISIKNHFKEFTSRAAVDGAHLWTQLGHAEALSHISISDEPKGVSSLNLERLQCARMSVDNIQALPPIYAKAAYQAKEVGFSGVQIYARLGFLLSQFLSPLFNRR